MSNRPGQLSPDQLVAAKRDVLAVLQIRRKSARLGRTPKLMPAAAIGRWLGLWPRQSRESIRRRVRELIEQLRHDGHQVVADSSPNGGYYLADSAADLVGYAQERRGHGLHHLAAASAVRHSFDLADATGQLALFPGLRQETRERSAVA